jgi:hypothetical protein
MGQTPAVVIKFQGRSQILRIGEMVNGYRVSSIQAQQCVLVRGDERLTLACEKALESLEELKMMEEGTISVSAPDDTIPPDMNF